MSDDGKPDGAPLVLTKQTAVSMSLVVAIMMPLVWMVRGEQKILGRFDIQQMSIDANARAVAELRLAMELEFQKLGQQVDEKTSDRLTRTMFANWLELVRAANVGRDITFPPPPK